MLIHRLAEAVGAVLEKVAVPVLMATLSVLVFFQVLNRFILHIPAAWTEEFSRYAFVWLSLLGAAEATRTGANLNVEFLQDRLGGTAKRVMVFVSDLLSIAFFGFIAYQGFSWTFKNGFKVVADTVPLPMFYIQVILPVAATIIVFFIVDHLVITLRKNEGGGKA